MHDCPRMKLIADSLGRLQAARLFRPGHVFDACTMPDGSIRLVELKETPVPVAKVRIARDGIIGFTRLTHQNVGELATLSVRLPEQ